MYKIIKNLGFTFGIVHIVTFVSLMIDFNSSSYS